MSLESAISELTEAVLVLTDRLDEVEKRAAEAAPSGRVLTIDEFSKQWPAFPEGRIYELIRYRKKHGLTGSVMKLGGRWFVDEDRFFDLGRRRADNLLADSEVEREEKPEPVTAGVVLKLSEAS